MPKRVRSPNYPSIGLAEALERLARLFEEIQTHSAPPEVAAKGIGYARLHGASRVALSALGKYGLLDRVGEEYKISERGMMCLHPHDEDERQRAILGAAKEPKLFAEISERYPDGPPSDELLRSYLLRMGFSQTALSSVVLSYRETMALVERARRDLVEAEHGPEAAPSSEQAEEAELSTEAEHSLETQTRAISTPQSVTPSGTFRVSMTDEFFVDVSATRLDRTAVRRLVAWLTANEQLVPESVPTGEEQVDG